MRNAADMPELREDVPAGFVHGVSGKLPSLGVAVRENTGREDIALGLFADVGRFRNDEACRGALGVIRGLKLAHVAVIVSPRSRKWRHDDAVRERQRSKLDGTKQVGFASGRG